MTQDMAQTFHVSPTVFFIIVLTGLIVAALMGGFFLNRFFHHWTKKFQNSWGEFFFSLLESLPLPLLVLAALYTALEIFTLSRQYAAGAYIALFAMCASTEL